jgi:hypothetical protein
LIAVAAATLSPELALVDPVLREDALRELPPIKAFDFLRFEGAPRRHPDLDRFAFLAEHPEAESLNVSLAVAAGAYALKVGLTVGLLGAAFTCALVIAISVIQLFT